MTNRKECEFDLMRLVPELQVKIFEALPSPVAAMDLAMTCRALNTLFATYKTQILAGIRDNMVATFYEYYAFHMRFHIPDSEHIKHPPRGGWPTITPEVCSQAEKSDFVLQVLRHLPYIRGYPLGTKIDYMSLVVDYSERPWCLGANDKRYDQGTARFSRKDFAHKIIITNGIVPGGIEIILDTRTGVVSEERLLEL